MDPSDARRLVRDLCRRSGVDPGAVLGRDRTASIIAARRECVRELLRCGLSYSQVGAILGRDRRSTWCLANRRSRARIARQAVSATR